MYGTFLVHQANLLKPYRMLVQDRVEQHVRSIPKRLAFREPSLTLTADDKAYSMLYISSPPSDWDGVMEVFREHWRAGEVWVGCRASSPLSYAPLVVQSLYLWTVPH